MRETSPFFVIIFLTDFFFSTCTNDYEQKFTWQSKSLMAGWIFCPVYRYDKLKGAAVTDALCRHVIHSKHFVFQCRYFLKCERRENYTYICIYMSLCCSTCLHMMYAYMLFYMSIKLFRPHFFTCSYIICTSFLRIYTCYFTCLYRCRPTYAVLHYTILG